MANLHLLANRPSLARHRDVDTLVAVATDGTDARADAIARLTRLGGALETERLVIEAVELRLTRRPPVPAPATLQDLVRSGRRRLERERQGGRRAWFGSRLAAVGRLRGVLES